MYADVIYGGMWDDQCLDSAESRIHELLTIAELEIDFLLLAAESASIRAAKTSLFFFLFWSVICIECFVSMIQLADRPTLGKINLLAERLIYAYTYNISLMNKYNTKIVNKYINKLYGIYWNC